MIATLIARFLPYIGLGIIASVLIAFGAGYYKGHSDATIKSEFHVITKEVKDVHTQQGIEKKVMALPDPDLDSRLDKWYRD